MVNIVTLIVITVFCKRSFIIINELLLLNEKQFCVARKTALFFNYLSNSALLFQAIPSLSVTAPPPRRCNPAFQPFP